MKLIFSPYYDQQLFTGIDEGCTIGEKYVGPMGLLDELELRAGLCRNYSGQLDRVMRYCEALNEYGKSTANPEKLVYWKSFNVDMLNVASRILEWRDALVYAGFKSLGELPEGLGVGAAELLTVLQDVEEYFSDESSVGDRWMRLACEEDYMSDGWEIEVRMKKEHVDPIILKCIQRSGARCTFVDSIPDPEHKVKILKFANLIDGYQWAFTEEDGSADVYVNRDNVALNSVFDSLGMPNVDAQTSGSFTPVMQLFASGMKLFDSPVDYDSLVSYLSVPEHPLNDYVTLEGKRLRDKLLCHLTSKGGFGYDERSKCDWKDIIAAAKPYDGRVTMVPLEFCIGQWEQNKDIATITECCKHWSKWCLRRAALAKDEALRQQLLVLNDTFIVFPRYFAFAGGVAGVRPCVNMDRQELKPLRILVDSVSSLASYSLGAAVKGSHEVVGDMKAIAADCRKAVWMDCYDKGISSYTYSFINSKDISLLNEAGMMIPLYDQQLNAEGVAMQLAYSYIKDELVVLTPEKVECSKMYPVQIPHHDMSEQDMTQWTPDGEELSVVPANQQKLEHVVNSAIFRTIPSAEEAKSDPTVDTQSDSTMETENDSAECTVSEDGVSGQDDQQELKGFRDYESFGSLDLLVQHPFDYVFEYIFNCKQTSESNLSLVKGNVVHHMINAAVVGADCDWTKIKASLVGDFDAVFDKAVHDVGLPLLMESNNLEYSHFRKIVKEDSIPAFINVVESNSLTVVASETDFMVELDDIGTYNARIDMLLKNSAGKYVVMDFKWSDSSESKREEEIKKNKEVQLALYAEAVRNHFCGGKADEIEAIGYFMLKQGVLLTEYNGFVPCKEVKVVKKKVNASIFDMLRKSYLFRVKQLRGNNGESVIEEAEGIKLNDGDLAYLSEAGLFPLNIESKSKSDNYGKNVVLKGMLK